MGPSRKSFLAGGADGGPADRDWATAAAVTAAILEGAHVVRVHRVREMRQVAEVADRCRDALEARRRVLAEGAGARVPAPAELPRSV
ncbi:MAG: dihydropteroate synthase [Acidobacteria bacterium]|nr:dihydropteroate synthase [Acidobacteriota bacterium]